MPKRAGSSFLLLLCILTEPFVNAQNPAGDLSNLSLEELMKVQVVTASKHAQDASESPASVTVVTREDIQTFGYRTLADVLQGVRGFWVTSDRNYSYVGVRGFSRPGDYNTRILLLVNGHRLNDNVFDEALIGTEFPLDIDLVERIEIVRGPSSSLYGTNAFFGVINVITRQPDIAPTVEASGEAGANLMRKGRVTAGNPDILDGALFSASVYRSDGINNLYFPEFESPLTNNGIAHRVDGDRYESAMAVVHWRHFQFQALIGSREKLVPTGSFGTIFNDPANRTTDSRGFGEMLYQRQFVSGLQLMTRWYYDGYGYHGTYAGTPAEGGLEFDSARGDWVGTEFTASRPLGHLNILTAGGEFRYNLKQIQHTQLQFSSAPLLDSRPTSSVFAVYGQDELKIASRLSVNAGLRLDYYTTFGTAISPRVAGIYRPDAKTALKYSFGKAFAAPNAFQLYYSDGSTQEVNPTLKPENIASHDLGVERLLTPAIHVVAEAFYNRLDNMLDDQLDPATGMYRYVNVNSSSGKGMEFELNAQEKKLRGQVSYTVQRSVDLQTRAMLANSPLHLAKLNVQAPVLSGLWGGIELQYRSPQLTFQDVRIPDSLVTNLTISSRKPVLGFDVSASCYNLPDRRNYDPITPDLTQTRLLQDGREFRFKISRRISRN